MGLIEALKRKLVPDEEELDKQIGLLKRKAEKAELEKQIREAKKDKKGNPLTGGFGFNMDSPNFKL